MHVGVVETHDVEGVGGRVTECYFVIADGAVCIDFAFGKEVHEECVNALMFVGVNIIQVMQGNRHAEFILLSSDELLWFGAGIEDEELRFAFFVRADECVN